MSNRRYNTQTRKNFLSGGQAKLDKMVMVKSLEKILLC